MKAKVEEMDDMCKISNVKLSDKIEVPIAFRNAIDLITKLQKVPIGSLILALCSPTPGRKENVLFIIGYEDGFFSIGWNNTENEEQIEKMKSGENFNCTWYYNENGKSLSKFNVKTDDRDFAMRFLRDLFIYLNPVANIDNITVSLDFSEIANHLGVYNKGESFEYDFYPDGKESSMEQFEKLIDLHKRYILENES